MPVSSANLEDATNTLTPLLKVPFQPLLVFLTHSCRASIHMPPGPVASLGPHQGPGGEGSGIQAAHELTTVKRRGVLLLIGLIVKKRGGCIRLHRLNAILTRSYTLVHFAAANDLSIAGFEGKVVFVTG